MVDQWRKPSDGTRPCESHLGATLRHRSGRDARRLRLAGRQTDLSRVARRTGGALPDRHALESKDVAARNRFERCVSPVGQSVAGPARTRPGEPATRARTAVSSDERGTTRSGVGCRRTPQSKDVWAASDAVSASRYLAYAVRRS